MILAEVGCFAKLLKLSESLDENHILTSGCAIVTKALKDENAFIFLYNLSIIYPMRKITFAQKGTF